MPDRMSLSEAVALAVCYAGCSEAWPTDHIADEVWASLNARGLLATSRDFTGEGTTVTTQAGQLALALALKLEKAVLAMPDREALQDTDQGSTASIGDPHGEVPTEAQ